ncbi:major facilitator superfamily domain-containing protein 4A-like [Pecten maximus]|uniref:major facilitator superfamily domain-containing protein 4A-like n=1 Tax=Pecten maximus TaxID=6579 RepID=UPI00145872B6|nr:major facilitator superfamily domain-containing protein 4A-like [Pecten maximus]
MGREIKAAGRNGSNTRRILERVFQKIRTSTEYRDRVLLTLCIYLSFAVIGGTKGQLGPALLDLIAISGVDLSQGAFIVTFLYIGYTIGAMLNGVLYHRFRRTSLFAFCCCWMGITTSVIPWCSVFPLMLGMHALLGLFQGVVDAGGNAEVIKLWKKDSRTLVVGLHLVFNIGGVLSPIIIAPFLMKNPALRNSSDYKQDFSSNNNGANFTINQRYTLMYSLTNSSTTSENTTVELLGREEFTSRIHIAFIISAIACLVVSCLFMFLHFSKKFNLFKQSNNITTEVHDMDGNVSKTDKTTFKISRTFKMVALFVMIAISTLCKAIDHAFAAYLSSYCVDALDWSTQVSSYLTSVYFVSVVIGGICGTIMTKVTSLVIYEGIQVVLVLVSFVCLSFSITYSSSVGIWIAASLFGFSKSVIFPLTLAWTNDTFIKISGENLFSIFHFDNGRECYKSSFAWVYTDQILKNVVLLFFSF